MDEERSVEILMGAYLYGKTVGSFNTHYIFLQTITPHLLDSCEMIKTKSTRRSKFDVILKLMRTLHEESSSIEKVFHVIFYLFNLRQHFTNTCYDEIPL